MQDNNNRRTRRGVFFPIIIVVMIIAMLSCAKRCREKHYAKHQYQQEQKDMIMNY